MQRGETWAVCGPNGSGKSTMLRVMSGLLRPTSGAVTLCGVKLDGLPRRDVATRLALVPQDVEVVFDFTAREVVAMGRTPYGSPWRAPSDDDRRIVDEELERFDLTRLADKPAMELSGGERKRVALARAFAQRTEVLLLDEPTASLDAKAEASFFRVLGDATRERGTTVVLVLHDFAGAARAATHAMLMRGGTVMASGAADDVLTAARLGETFGVTLERREVLVVA